MRIEGIVALLHLLPVSLMLIRT